MSGPLQVVVTEPERPLSIHVGRILGNMAALALFGLVIWWLAPQVTPWEPTYWEAVGARLLANAFLVRPTPSWVKGAAG